MDIKLVRIGLEDAKRLWELQTKAFEDLYETYQDTDTSPATEKLEKIVMRLEQDFTYFYYIVANGVTVGAIRIVDFRNDEPKRISPLFIIKEHRGKGYAQKAMLLAEELHGGSNWELETILQEKGNCYLYEKMGYYQTGKTHQINEKLTLVFYKKD